MNQLDLFNNAEAWEEPRLKTQLDRIFNYMKDGSWRKLHEISKATGASEAGVSAQLRHLRKKKHREKYRVSSVLKRLVKKGKPLREYKIILQGENQC